MLLRVPTIHDSAGAADGIPSTYRSATIGTVELGELAVLRDWTLACDDVGTDYYLQVPVSGRFHSHHRGASMMPDRRTIAVYQPGTGPFLARWSAGYRALCITLNAAAVDAALTSMLGGQAPKQVTFQPSMNASSGHARNWAELLLSLRRCLDGPDNLLAQPMVAAPLAESLIHGFLLAASHSHSAALREPALAAGPAAIRSAVDLIEADPQASLTVSFLAARCGVSVRTLQNGFRRHLGMPPLAYLRDVRLRRAHEDLCAADPGTGSVAEVARRWGFGHLGRFAAAHEAKYGQTPLRTLRG